MIHFLQDKLNSYPHEDYPTKSRVHRLQGYNAFVKREDELGFGVSGFKFRKYRSLIPYIRSKGNKEVVIIGGPFSNHVLSLTQLLLENGIQPTLVLKGPRPTCLQGNFLFLQMLVPPESIHWVAKERWDEVDSIAASKKGMVIPEGGNLFPSFIGALTLPLDIIRNENELGMEFDHIFMDVGTGLSAAALLLGFAYLKKATRFHLLHVADTKEAFCELLEEFHKEFEQFMGTSCPFPSEFDSFYPTISPSFGSTNQALFDFIIKEARCEGFLLDPIYSAKLFFETKHILQSNEEVKGNVLVIHSGGALSLAGFQKSLQKLGGIDVQ